MMTRITRFLTNQPTGARARSKTSRCGWTSTWRANHMLITFKSKGSGDVQMFSEHAEQILSVIGKTLEPSTAPSGIVTADQVPDALARLKAAADAARDAARNRSDVDDAQGAPKVGLAQRAYPLIELFERAARKQQDVVWGV
ncbi:MAG: DUF1840 domain-containing protein [Burkholderiaceae bacterium]